MQGESPRLRRGRSGVETLRGSMPASPHRHGLLQRTVVSQTASRQGSSGPDIDPLGQQFLMDTEGSPGIMGGVAALRLRQRLI